ncbi:MAG: (R)-mandelonitrile lyase [Candidatus Dormibacteria bacterium]
MKINRGSQATVAGSSEWFTGSVFIDTVASVADGSGVNASAVHFAPGARTAWHTHPLGQAIFVTEGVGRVQRRGGAVEMIGPGDRVFFEPGEDHWHGAARDRFMTHISVVQVGPDGQTATWGPHVSDEEYSAAPAID